MKDVGNVNLINRLLGFVHTLMTNAKRPTPHPGKQAQLADDSNSAATVIRMFFLIRHRAALVMQGVHNATPEET